MAIKKSRERRKHCPECGGFVAKDDESLKENGWCRTCDWEGIESLLIEEAERDPSGPAAFALTGDNSRLRKGYQ